ncbi:IspA Geranylgeranyl pyrophosphate synthase [Methylophilaceae bacterium]
MTIQALNYQSTANFYSSFSIDDLTQQVDCLIQNTLLEQSAPFSVQNICIEAIKYHFDSPGQQVRAKSCLDACMKLAVEYDDMLILAASAELLHNASLIHDDIQDEDEIRRGQTSVWKKYGINIAICAGDLLLSTAYGMLARYSKPSLIPQLISIINKQTRLAIEGQSLDVLFKKNPQLSLEQYVVIASQKSGALFSLPIELALVAAQRNDCTDLARKACANFAIGYQIADDLEDVVKDGAYNHASQSVNITYVLKNLGYKNAHQQSVALCLHYLDEAIQDALHLPNNSGSILISLAENLKVKLSINE